MKHRILKHLSLHPSSDKTYLINNLFINLLQLQFHFSWIHTALLYTFKMYVRDMVNYGLLISVMMLINIHGALSACTVRGHNVSKSAFVSIVMHVCIEHNLSVSQFYIRITYIRLFLKWTYSPTPNIHFQISRDPPVLEGQLQFSLISPFFSSHLPIWHICAIFFYSITNCYLFNLKNACLGLELEWVLKWGHRVGFSW